MVGESRLEIGGSLHLSGYQGLVGEEHAGSLAVDYLDLVLFECSTVGWWHMHLLSRWEPDLPVLPCVRVEDEGEVLPPETVNDPQ